MGEFCILGSPFLMLF